VRIQAGRFYSRGLIEAGRNVHHPNRFHATGVVTSGPDLRCAQPRNAAEVRHRGLAAPRRWRPATAAALRGVRSDAPPVSDGSGSDILLRTAQGVARRKEEIASAMTAEMGKPINSRAPEVDRCVSTFTIAAEEASAWPESLAPVDIEAHTAGFQATP